MTKSSLTEKQEAFARYVVEGDTYSAAYRKSYNAENMLQKSIWEKSSELMANVKVSSRVMELQEAASSETLYTMKKATEEFEELRAKALADGQYAPAVSAVEKKAKLHGLFEKDNKQKGMVVNITSKDAQL